MKIIVIDENTRRYAHPTSLAIGFFDGVHLGHRRILKTALDGAGAGVHSAVFTFLDNSEFKRGVPRIMSESEKLSLISEMGFDVAFLCPFEQVRNMDADEFIDKYLVGICGCECAVCGGEFRFGRGAASGAEELRRKIPRTLVCEELMYDGAVLSSTRIRRELESGNVERARDMLGYSYCVVGEVLHGKALGGKLGFPTVNQRFDPAAVVPRYGVYMTYTHIDGARYLSVSNVGMRPTVEGDFVNIETNIIGFEGNLYSRSIKVELVKFIREERKFDSVDALREQVMRDRAEVMKYADME